MLFSILYIDSFMLRRYFLIPMIFCSLCACVKKGPNPEDPYEVINRRIYHFNDTIDKTVLKPAALAYKAVLPAAVRGSINNVYRNVSMLPTIANDILQLDQPNTIKDTWRFLINSSLGLGGLFDPAASTCNLPFHSNDLGLTFAKWGDKKSPYIVIPLLGPSTIRDGMGMLFDYTLFSPYFYIPQNAIIYGLFALRYVDLRSQLLDADKLMEGALDRYSFLRDAYLQNRNALILGPKNTVDHSQDLYVED